MSNSARHHERRRRRAILKAKERNSLRRAPSVDRMLVRHGAQPSALHNPLGLNRLSLLIPSLMARAKLNRKQEEDLRG